MKTAIKRKGITEKYLKFLNVLKSELNNNSIKEPHYMMVKHNVSTHWLSFLQKNNIIYRDENYNYKWNDKIPISTKVVEAFRNNVKEKQIKYKEKLKMQYTQPELEFNLSNVVIPENRKSWESAATTEKWLHNLFFVKNELDNTEYYKLMDLKSALPNWKAWQAFLVRNNIIYKKNTGRYIWDNKIPITYKIIEAYRKEQRINNYRQKTINKQLETQPEIQFDMPQTPLPPKPKTRTKSYQDKMKEKVNNAKQVNKPTQQNEYGLIRKFLKWIY
jgi:hypothetical protein